MHMKGSKRQHDATFRPRTVASRRDCHLEVLMIFFGIIPVVQGSVRRGTLACLAVSFMPWLAGCEAFVPQRDRPDEGELPSTYSLAETRVACEQQWWKEFESEELDTLIDEALRENLSLRQFWARVQQADALATQSGAQLYPQFDVLGEASYRRTSLKVDRSQPSFKVRLGEALAGSLNRALTNTTRRALGSETGEGDGFPSSRGTTSTGTDRAPGRVTESVNQFGLSLAASYEVDLWGRIASGYRAARYDAEAVRADLETTAITLVAEVVDRWIRLQEQRELRAVLEDQLATNKTYLELVELRFRQGQVSALDVYQQRQAVTAIERQIPRVEAGAQVLRHELAVLLGKPPMSDLEPGLYDLEQVPDFPEIGVPADLLVQRPDVRAALADLNAADYRVAAARADRLPAIRLTGGIGYRTDEIAHLLDDWFLNLAAGLSQPLFDGFRRQAEVERTLAVVEERLAFYRLAILTALREVEDALVQERRQREYIEALTRQTEEARNALREASRRYQTGLSTYLPVLTELERTQFLARELITARRELLVFRINLYRALGGTWPGELTAPVPLSEEAELTKANAS